MPDEKNDGGGELMQVTFSNREHPELGSVILPFPIPYEEYENSITRLASIGLGAVTARNCYIESVIDEAAVLQCLKGTLVNVDEVDYLWKNLEILASNGDFEKFECMAALKGYTDIKDLINLALCCPQATVIKDFSNLKEVGMDHFLTIRGGSAPADEASRQDGEQIMRELIASGKGHITPYGVVFENDMEMKELYQGGNFPAIGYEPSLADAILTPTVAPQEREMLRLLLPMPEKQLERMLERAGFETDRDYTLEFMFIQMPKEISTIIETGKDGLYEINHLCQILRPLEGPEMERLAAAVAMANAERSSQIRRLVENIDQFRFAKDVRTADDYGLYLIQESGRYGFDKDLAR